ncbi:MAG: aldo/keto reductase [Polaromonas sp.]|nr:aldo/keto reductase [Polaromonas sp.]
MPWAKMFKVSRLGLGTMMMGWRMDLEESIEVLATARAHGITFLDSSVSYARGGCPHYPWICTGRIKLEMTLSWLQK